MTFTESRLFNVGQPASQPVTASQTQLLTTEISDLGRNGVPVLNSLSYYQFLPLVSTLLYEIRISLASHVFYDCKNALTLYIIPTLVLPPL